MESKEQLRAQMSTIVEKLDRLSEVYNQIDIPSIQSFLKKHSEVEGDFLDALLNAAKKLQRIFPPVSDAPIKFNINSEEGYDDLMVLIPTEMGIDAARICLDKFNDWWTKQPFKIQRLALFDAEYV